MKLNVVSTLASILAVTSAMTVSNPSEPRVDNTPEVAPAAPIVKKLPHSLADLRVARPFPTVSPVTNSTKFFAQVPQVTGTGVPIRPQSLHPTTSPIPLVNGAAGLDVSTLGWVAAGLAAVLIV